MFGLFGSSELQNSSFNNALIAALGDSIRKNNRYPTESELLASIKNLVGNHKLTKGQINSIDVCVISTQMGFGDELRPLLIGMQKELPQGGRENYDRILELLARHAIITTDESLEFLRKLGIN